MTHILTTLYGFPCIEKQKPEYGILTLPFSIYNWIVKKNQTAFSGKVSL